MLNRRRFLKNMTGIGTILMSTRIEAAALLESAANKGKPPNGLTHRTAPPETSERFGEGVPFVDAHENIRSTIDAVLERVNIFDVISQYVKLHRDGENFLGLCPFHTERTPSFVVSVEKQIYYCFGCHEGGNAIHFLAKYDRVSYQEALKSLLNQVE